MTYRPGTIHVVHSRFGALHAVADREGVLSRAFSTRVEAEQFRDEHFTREELEGIK